MVRRGKPARVEWSLTGVHNQLNALAAIAAAHHVGVEPAQATRRSGPVQNVKRRMECAARWAVWPSDDFAHHPALRTTLDGLRRTLGAGHASGGVWSPQQHHETGRHENQLPWALEPADTAFCHRTAGLDWDAADGHWHRWASGPASAPNGPRRRYAGGPGHQTANPATM